MIRRSALANAGGMRPQYGLLADIDLWMRLAMQSAVGYVSEPVIIVRQDRPLDYPVEYKAKGWSWSRQCHLYKIHADNRLAYYNGNRLLDRARWWQFRLRLNIETAKWLTYAVLCKKPDIIRTSDDSVTDYDYNILRLYRLSLRLFYEAFGKSL